MIELILGGARSGKSRLAEETARRSGNTLVYIATAQAGDEEMTARIAQHRRQRGDDWILIEESRDLVTALQQACGHNRCVVVDCLTLWLSNCLISDKPDTWERAKRELLEQLPSLEGHIILVSNEVGQGVVPANALARTFIDESGRLHQQLAALCDRVSFVVAGIPQILKEN